MLRDRAIVSVATHGHYVDWVKKMAASLNVVSAGGEELQVDTGEEFITPIPYKFKVNAMGRARKLYRAAMWCDASMRFIRSPGPLFARAAKCGACLFDSGWKLGQWSNDRSLAKLGITRDIAMSIPLVIGGAWAVDFSTKEGAEFFGTLASVADEVFPGAWGNLGNTESEDHRVLGHRHDMVAMSAIAWRMKIPIIDDELRIFAYPDKANNDTIVKAGD